MISIHEWYKRVRAIVAAATDAATRDATTAATDAATRAATDAATRAATAAATDAATDAALVDATYAKTWYTGIEGLRELGLALCGRAGLQCAALTWKFRQGGNQWSAWDSYITAGRYIYRLPIDYSKWDAWEKLSLHSGVRYVHEKFCIISDRPEVLLVDEQNRPHCETGPFCRWRDGFSLYAIHGVRVPAWLVEHPELLTTHLIKAEQNAEIRRIMIQRFGEVRWIEESGMQPVGPQDRFGQLFIERVEAGRPIARLKVINSTPEPDGSFKIYWLPINPDLYGGDAGRYPQAAAASTWRVAPGSKELLFKNWRDYNPVQET